MPRLTIDCFPFPLENEALYYMPAGSDWCELDGIFADPDDKSWDFAYMYGYWRVGGYAIATMNTRGDCLVRVEWDDEKREGILVPVLGGSPLPYKSSDKDIDPVVRARMIGLLEVLAWVSRD